MLTFFRPTISADLLAIVSAQLDAYVQHAQKKRRGKAEDRIYWFRRGNTFVIAEEFVAENGDLTGRDAAKFSYEDGKWHLYCIDASRKWRRYGLAPAEERFSAELRYFQDDVTGIFRSRLVSGKRRRVSDADIERNALAVLVGARW